MLILLSNPDNFNDISAIEVPINAISDVTATNVQEALEQIAAQENNFSRVINVTSIDLDGVAGATLEDQIVNYVNSLNYDKLPQDSEIWIEYTVVAPPEVISTFDGMILIS